MSQFLERGLERIQHRPDGREQPAPGRKRRMDHATLGPMGVEQFNEAPLLKSTANQNFGQLRHADTLQGTL